MSHDANVHELLVAVQRALEDQITHVEEAIRSTGFTEPAKITLTVTFKPATESQEPAYTVSARTSIPGPGSEFKVGLENGQLRLL